MILKDPTKLLDCSRANNNKRACECVGGSALIAIMAVWCGKRKRERKKGGGHSGCEILRCRRKYSIDEFFIPVSWQIGAGGWRIFANIMQ